ncbi:Retrovirus-related Pol polyprotein from transposon TNT 1-94 [Sesamum angolense]|uniref:Retrovirus-related Pol polyprotein from transposon TNT 1-94 n=1 Tax=Sesamum angolense TaxID=2727404 RepID=A0AAE1T5Y7_9LAMI|nr:Retrovirus-related Pol polyprotein from transposon TNT 1-94 [Sesamum angolense]
MDKPLPQTLPDGSSSEEHETFERWHANHRKVRSIILASMSNDVQKQYDMLDDVASILQRTYVVTKEFYRAKMTEGSSMQEHGVKMLSLVEKLEDLKAGHENDIYIDMILQSLPPSYDPFIVNFNMNGLEKSINELINMLVQYEATIKKSAPSVLIGEASTSKAKGKRAGCWKRKKGKAKAKIVIVAKDVKSAPVAPMRIGKGKRRMDIQQQSRANDICAYCREKGHWKRDGPNLSSNQGMLVVEVNMVTNSASWVLDTGSGAHICNNLQMLQRSRKLSKDEVVLRLGDGKGVAAEAGRGGFSYFITFIDDHSRYGYVYLMRYKSEAFVRFKEFRLETPPGAPQLNGVAERRNRTLLDMIRSIMSFIELPLSFSGYALEMAARLLNIAPSKTVAQMPYLIWHGKPASYKYLREWGSPANVKRLVGDKLDSRNAVFLERGFSIDTRCDELLLEESSEAPQSNAGTSSAPTVSADNVPILHRDLYGSARGIHGSRRRVEGLPSPKIHLWLKASSRSWNIRFDEVIRGYNFVKNDFDPCVYKKVSGSSVVFVVLYVDDILLIGNDIKMLGDTKAWLSTQFTIKDLGSIQNAAQCTRPDIAYALSVTSRYQACAGEAHWTAVKTILKYLRRTKDMFLVYDGGELILEGFSDASFQSDDDDAKSQSGFVFKLNGGVVAWKSSKHDTTTDSTTEGEFIAASKAAKGAKAKELRSHHRSKHILRRYHLLREMVGRGDVRMDRVSSVENTTDPLTKPVSQIAQAQYLGKMGLRQMSD